MSSYIECISQELKQKVFQTKYKIEWLVNNTEIKVFNPITFTGYQRKIDVNHVDKIVKYLCENELFMPSAIICSSEKEYNEETRKLFIVDGQHRIEAFRTLAKKNPEKYNSIKDYEIPVVILENPDEKLEIDTFITINKTAKKVDTSLAYILKNIKNKNISSDELEIPKRDYLAVETARFLNEEERFPLWKHRILYEGLPKNTFEFITLNAFVKAMRTYLSMLDKYGVIKCFWKSQEEIEKIVKIIADIIEHTWKIVYEKFPELYSDNDDERRVIQGTIGFVTINRFLSYKLSEKNQNFMTVEEYKRFIDYTIKYEMNSRYEFWKPGGGYAAFSSEAGYRAIIKDMLKYQNNSL